MSKAPISLVELEDEEDLHAFIAHAPAQVAEPLPLTNGNYLYLNHRLGLTHAEKYLTTLEYTYTLQSEADNDDSWIFRYEYKRDQPADYPYPLAHVHVNAKSPGGYGTEQKDFSDLHLPTGRVTVEAVVRHLICEHGIEPISPNWEQTLTDTEAAFAAIQKKRYQG